MLFWPLRATDWRPSDRITDAIQIQGFIPGKSPKATRLKGRQMASVSQRLDAQPVSAASVFVSFDKYNNY
jgi:hypothetical protein